MKRNLPCEPTLRFTPTAWAKLLCLRDAADAEVGGFGLTSPDDPLLVHDILLVKQEVSSVTVAFDDEAVADLFEDLVAEGRHPEEFARIWVHTHPGSSPNPSGVDEQTFTRVFGTCHWAVMFILARGGQSYARIRFGVGPGGEMEIAVDVDYSVEFDCSDHAGWLDEYRQRVSLVETLPMFGPAIGNGYGRSFADWEGVWSRDQDDSYSL